MKHKFQISNFKFLLPVLGLLTSCNLIQQPENIPSYIRVQSYKDTARLGQGTASSNITDFSVDDNADYRGIYQMPSSVPILATGPTTIALDAFVQEDGIVSNLLPYPFYTEYKATVNLQPGKLDTIRPVFYYNSSVTKFVWPQGDFETTNPLKTAPTNTANAFQTSDKDSVFEGRESYEVDFNPGDTFDALSSVYFTTPASGVVWLEMNYKNDVPMDVGINPFDPSNPTAESNPEFISGVNPTSKWKKVYINIGPELQYFSQYPDFLIYFYATSASKAHIFIDNLKLLYLE